MEVEPASKPLSSTKPHKIPPDVNASDPSSSYQDSYSGLGLAWPLLYGPLFILALIFGILSLVFGLRHPRIRAEPTPFWGVFVVFLVVVLWMKVATIIQFLMIPAFWRARVRQVIREGIFDPKADDRRKLVLEVGCTQGATSAAFARAIIDNAGNSALPIFIGYDKWSWWPRIPNSPASFLSNLLRAGVPRECIIANRLDATSEESRTQLPYPSDSISLIISSFGLSQLFLRSSDRARAFRELVRILEPNGRMVMVETWDAGRWDLRKLWHGPLTSYRRILIEQGWPPENAVIRWDRGMRYMLVVKPAGAGGTV